MKISGAGKVYRPSSMFRQRMQHMIQEANSRVHRNRLTECRLCCVLGGGGRGVLQRGGGGGEEVADRATIQGECDLDFCFIGGAGNECCARKGGVCGGHVVTSWYLVTLIKE